MSKNLKFETRKALFTEPDANLWEEGECVFIRTVTYHLIGKIIKVIKSGSKEWLVLDNASWVADSGRFTQSINDGTLNEVEPVGCVVRVNTDSITDVFVWSHALPDKQK
jgi:hypothetical protein